MAVTSTNINPKNDSKYARRKSIKKGTHNKLRELVGNLRGTSGVTVKEYLGPGAKIIPSFNRDWADGRTEYVFGAYRKIGTFMNSYVAQNGVPRKMRDVLKSEALQNDLGLIWDDVNQIFYRRFGNTARTLTLGGASEGAKAHFQTKDALIVWAYGPASFDLIISKHGYDVPGYSDDPHFYIWQARDRSNAHQIAVDDYTMAID